MTQEHVGARSALTAGLERMFEEWAGNKPVEFPDMDKDPVSFWCWKAWQKATELAHQTGGATRWRDVADELPKEAQEVLFVRGGKVVHGAWIGGIFWHSNQEMAAAKWMPMPKPPEVGAGDTAMRSNARIQGQAESGEAACSASPGMKS